MIDAKLDEIRRKLLDLTRNNRLLNHRATTQRTLQLVDELPGEVYRILVEDGKVMQFLSREEAGPEVRDAMGWEDSDKSIGPLPLAPFDPEPGIAQRHRDQKLQTALSGDKLQSRLLNIAREANSALQEQGCNILYLTFGMVRWRAAEEGSEISSAPLVFVPVQLNRKTVNSRYSMQMFDDDILANPCLAELCQIQFKFSLPVFDAEKDELADYLKSVGEAISEMDGWSLEPEIHLGLSSFSKLLMYRDLDPRSWPQPEQLTGHPLIQCLTGTASNLQDGEQIPDPATLDDSIQPAECFQIVDADSSQQSAIVAAKRGMSMVIDGPPGTGKSQTITNIIAECLAAGKTVLFVSEKSAALEVVRRRLEKSGLGDFVLELHSRQASKKAVLEDINRALGRETTTKRISLDTAEKLRQSRDSLNRYRFELHAPLGGISISPFDAMSRAIGLSAEPAVECEIQDVLHWTIQQLNDAQQKLQMLDRRLGRVGDPEKHPWRGVGLQTAGLKEKQLIKKCIEQLQLAIRELLAAAAGLANQLAKPSPVALKIATQQASVAGALLSAPMELADVIDHSQWNAPDAELDAWLKLGLKRERVKQFWIALAKPEAETRNWMDILVRRISQQNSIWRFFQRSWYSDNNRLRGVMSDGKLPPVDQQIAMMTALTESLQLRNKIELKIAEYSAQFGKAWHGIDSDWSGLTKFAESAFEIRKRISAGELDVDTARKWISAADRAVLSNAANAVSSALSKLQESFQQWLQAIASNEKLWLSGELATAELPIQQARLSELPGQLERLDDWTDLNKSLAECSGPDLKAFVDWVMFPAGLPLRGRLDTAFSRHFYHLWVEESLSQRPSLAGFRGQDHEALIHKFRELDQQWLELTRLRLMTDLASRRPAINQNAHRQSKLGLVQAEMRKKARHMPLRKLLAAAGEVIQSIKPCFMMSPLSVAQYLAPGSLEFDVVVFDEASQVEPPDAYGAIARGRQLLLVGDERQLPPTNFFDRVDVAETSDDDSDEVHSVDLESILSLGIVRLPHRCGLRWHYRSRHSSLIQFSNTEFYDGQLRVFPSPHTDCSEMGVTFRFVENAVYKRGEGRFNPIEAQAVAKAVLQHAIDHPELSLGVGTLNQPQQRAIEDEIERLRRTAGDWRVEKFFADHLAAEPFFVKNLENIQGDERDVIFLSVGFGKDFKGQLHASFGALNNEGGWRRLNVLITRARQRCVVFSSIHADEINANATQARGVLALKDYLHLAEHAAAEQDRRGHNFDSGKEHDSDFEISICQALRDRGWEVHPQVGCAGFAIDLAVVDPRAAGRYLLGVECDGATYQSSATARDRDRLRHSVLTDLGWNLHRIWSSDWMHRPQTTLDALLKRLEQLKSEMPKAGKSDSTAPPPPAEPAESAEPAEPSKPPIHSDELPPGIISYEHCRDGKILGTQQEMVELTAPKLARVAKQIVEAEGPIHTEEALHVCSEKFGAKASARPREAFERAVAYLVTNGTVIRKGDFLWPANLTEVPIRHRGGDCPVTNAEMICPEEIDALVKLLLKQQFGLPFDAIAEAAARALGFGRCGAKFKSAIEQTLVRLDSAGEIQLDNARFVTLRAALDSV